MIPKLHIEKRIACPFYIQASVQALLSCEGLSNASQCVTKFDEIEQMERWIHRFCCQTPQHCPIYQGIIKAKYDSISPPLRLRRDHDRFLDMI